MEIDESSAAVLVFTFLLLVTLCLSYVFQQWKLRALHESLLATSLGILTGIIIHYSGNKHMEKVVSFDHRYFFNLLRPPMILNSGFEMDVQRFYRNLVPILVFAMLGSFISTAFNGTFLFLAVWSPLSGMRAMSFLDCLIFGAILSSTDPITMLAIFRELDIDKRIHTIIFGESVVNNAVSFVLFNVLEGFHNKQLTFNTFALGFFQFIGVFIGSAFVGALVGILIALVLKYSDLHKTPSLESCVVTLLAFMSYFMANVFQFTGIVSMLFTGIALKRYALPNLSLASKSTITLLFKLMAYLAENFIFIYLGVSLFTYEGSVRIIMVIVTCLIIFFSRFINIFSLSSLINYCNSWFYHSPEPYIPRNHQILLWWAGLRGAITFALSMNMDTDELKEMRTTTLIVVVITIFLFGGSTRFIMRRLDIKTNATHMDDYMTLHANNNASEQEDQQQQQQNTLDSWFLTFDRRYLLPWFVKKSVLQQEQSRRRETDVQAEHAPHSN